VERGTNDPSFENALNDALGPGRLAVGAPLAPLTTFRVGGAADWLADVRSVAELRLLLAIAHRANVAVTVLGGGSNVIVSDHGIRGLVVRPLLTAISQPDAVTVRAEAGVTINGLVRWTIGRGLSALEAWAGTPGTVGGALYGNAHWQGRNMSDVVTEVLLSTRSGELTTVPASAMAFGYDTSRLQRSGELLVSADFRVSPGDSAVLRAEARRSLAYRKRTQPLASPSAGCIFQNPDPARDRIPAGLPPSAGALVDRAGLKGRSVGGARISDTHGNFIVNEGTATANDIRTLVEIARRAVRDRFGVELRDEVVWLGAFD
jgi:UDP-N-acetylmuramate dehydrogenase